MTALFTPIQCVLVDAKNAGIFMLNDQRLHYDELPIGAMWFTPWKRRFGPDGKSLYVRLPGGHDWWVDGRASNCTRPDDHSHRCWVRHGQAPCITVDKNGDTCSAGAGSIVVPGWHGFLRNGWLELA